MPVAAAWQGGRRRRRTTLFTDDYRSVTDEHVARWRRHFSDTELIGLGALMALADGFGELVEVVGLGDAVRSCAVEV